MAATGPAVELEPGRPRAPSSAVERASFRQRPANGAGRRRPRGEPKRGRAGEEGRGTGEGGRSGVGERERRGRERAPLPVRARRRERAPLPVRVRRRQAEGGQGERERYGEGKEEGGEGES